MGQVTGPSERPLISETEVTQATPPEGEAAAAPGGQAAVQGGQARRLDARTLGDPGASFAAARLERKLKGPTAQGAPETVRAGQAAPATPDLKSEASRAALTALAGRVQGAPSTEAALKLIRSSPELRQLLAEGRSYKIAGYKVHDRGAWADSGPGRARTAIQLLARRTGDAIELSLGKGAVVSQAFLDGGTGLVADARTSGEAKTISPDKAGFFEFGKLTDENLADKYSFDPHWIGKGIEELGAANGSNG